MSSSLDSSRTSSGDKDNHQNPPMIGTHSLGLDKNYALSWGRLDAFRELVQNWKDGIVAAFDMDPRSFLPVWDETIAGEIRITVHRNIEGRRELVGFIVHKAKTGTVEIANFNANLSMDDLNIGGSTKRNNDKLAGTHGEGLKIAALVMIRDGFPVRIQSTSANWNFGFYKNQFLCQISQRNDSKIVAEKLSFREQTSGGKLRSEFVSYSYKDVTVQLSHPETGKGYRVSITAEEFRSWTTVSLDLSRPDPEKIIRAPHGDLIIDEKFGGQTFVKALRVKSQGLGGKSYKFGYNFVTGNLSRDRERSISYDEETKTLAKIWEGAVLHGPDNLVQWYIDLFEEDHADTISAEKASGYLARRIWTRLRTSKPNVFYYSEVSDPELSTRQVMIILNDFKKSPQKLAKELWQLLSKYDCARTPYEERVHIKFSPQLVEQVKFNFSRSVVRMLKSAMATDTRLAEMKLQFVESIHIDPKYDSKDKIISIHPSWLDFEIQHPQGPCEAIEISKHDDDGDSFYCDHVVEQLVYFIIIRSLVGIDKLKACEMSYQAREYVIQTPRGVRVSATSNVGELAVQWRRASHELVSPVHSSKGVYNVTLHMLSSCEARRDDLIIVPENDSIVSCGCPRQKVSYPSNSVCFVGLNPNEAYFPVVSHDGEKAFAALPPRAIFPRGHSEPTASESQPFRLSRSNFESNNFEMGGTGSTSEHRLRERDIRSVTLEARSHQSMEPNSDQEVYAGNGSRHASDGSFYSAASMTHAYDPSKPDSSKELEAGEESRSAEDAILGNTWPTEEFPKLRSLILTQRQLCRCQINEMSMFRESTLRDRRLGITFEKGDYYRIQDNSESYPVYIAWVHDIHDGGAGCVESLHLKITKFSIFQQEDLLMGSNNLRGTDGMNSLILHCTSLQDMGTEKDAEAVRVKDIVTAETLYPGFAVRYRPVAFSRQSSRGSVPGTPSNDHGDQRKMSCSFARSVKEETVTIMPVIPRLLDSENRPKPKGFSNALPISVIDFTPNVLGPLEGFADAGYHSFAAAGFSPDDHITWRVRNPRCPVFDGSPKELFEAFDSGKLDAPGWLTQNSPKIALVAGANVDLCSKPTSLRENELIPSLGPLEIMDSILQSRFAPDFKVLQMPSGVLQPKAMVRFLSTILDLLENGETVRINISSLKSFGCAPERYLVSTIASRLPGLAVVPIGLSSQKTDDNELMRINNAIQNLSFENNRESDQAEYWGGRFVCSPFRDMGITSPAPKYVYNHNTKIRSSELGHASFFPSFNLSHLAHQDTEDVEHGKYLTVREIARIQHFKDDFSFYGSVERQYEDVKAAQPPPVARAIAQCIKTVIEESGEKAFGDGSGGDRPNKRRREEC